MLHVVEDAIGEDVRFIASIEHERRESSVVVDFGGVRVADFSPDGLFRVYVGDYSTLLHAYEDEDQIETISRAIQLLRLWAQGRLLIRGRRSRCGRRLFFVDMGGFEQQVLRRSG
ncbi:hypothetical protein ACQP1U_11550 [Actinomycetota bacterium]